MQLSAMLRTWFPAITGMVCLGLGAGLIGIYGFFAPYLAETFDVGIATVNIGPVALLLVPGIVAPFVGKLVDRVPIRSLMLLGTSLAMLGLIGASQAPSLLLAGLSFFLFSLGIAMYGPVVVNGLLVKIYPGREARALAIAAIGISVATAILPPLVGALLVNWEWRQSLLALALGVWVLLLIAVLLGVPGGIQEVSASEVDASDEEKSFYSSREFWLVGICVALGMNVAIVLAICYPPHFIAQGFSTAEAGWFISLAGMAGLAGKTVLAVVTDRLRHYAKWIAALILGLQGLGLLLLPAATTQAQVAPLIFLLGFTGGAFLPMHSYLNSRYFDASVIGQVTGAQMPLFLPLGLIGPPLAGYLFDQSGNYHTMLYILVVVLAAATLLAMLLPAGRDAAE